MIDHFNNLDDRFDADWQKFTEFSFYKDILLSQETQQETPSEDTYCDEGVQDSHELRI